MEYSATQLHRLSRYGHGSLVTTAVSLDRDGVHFAVQAFHTQLVAVKSCTSHKSTVLKAHIIAFIGVVIRMRDKAPTVQRRAVLENYQSTCVVVRS